MIISLLAFILGRFVVHQPLVIVLRLLDAEIAGHGVHGDERFIEPFIQASNRLTQGFVFLNNDCRGLGLRQYCGSSDRATHIGLPQTADCVCPLRIVHSQRKWLGAVF